MHLTTKYNTNLNHYKQLFSYHVFITNNKQTYPLGVYSITN